MRLIDVDVMIEQLSNEKIRLMEQYEKCEYPINKEILMDNIVNLDKMIGRLLRAEVIK